MTAETRTLCPRDERRRCNHADPAQCCGGGYKAFCDCACHLESPWRSIETAPRDGRDLIGLLENGEEIGFPWADRRQCMLAGVGGGNGYFGPGWEDTVNYLVIHDDMTPTHWRAPR